MSKQAVKKFTERQTSIVRNVRSSKTTYTVNEWVINRQATDI